MASGLPSNPGWATGYTPTAAEWASAWSGKVDFPAPINQGGTGAKDEFTAEYNLSQRSLIDNTFSSLLSPMTRYGLQTASGSMTLNLPALASLKDGDWVYLADVDFNADSHIVTIVASVGDEIQSYAGSAVTQQIRTAGGSCVLVAGDTSWSMLFTSSSDAEAEQFAQQAKEDSDIATAQAAIATAQAAIATAQAALALTAGTSGNPYKNAAGTYLPQCITAFSLTSGGTGGTHNLTNVLATFSGGTLDFNPVIYFDTDGSGVVVNVRMTYKGLYIGTGTPTPPTVAFPGSAGGPAITLTVGQRYASGETYWVQSSDGSQILEFGNNGGSIAPVGPTGFNTTPQLSMKTGVAIDGLLQFIPPRFWQGSRVAVIWGFDASGTGLALLTADGNLYAKLATETDGAISVGYNQATGKTVFGLNTAAGARSLGGGAIADTTRVTYRRGRKILDSLQDSGGIDFATALVDGTTLIPHLETEDGAALERGAETASYFFDVATVSGKRQIVRNSKATGISTQITFSGANAKPALSYDSTAITYASDRYSLQTGAEKWTTMYQPIDGGAEHPMVSRPDRIICLGNSLFEGYGATFSFPDYLTGLLAPYGITVVNRGLGGQTLYMEACRIGAYTVPITVTGNSIAAGPNLVTALGGLAPVPWATLVASGAPPEPCYQFLSSATTVVAQVRGTLAGVTGAMVRYVDGAGNEVYTFTPDAGQTLPATCAANSPFQSIEDWRDATVLIEGGYNSLGQANMNAQQTNVTAIINYLAPKVKRFIVFNIPTGSSELTAGSPNARYINATTYNTWLAATYPNNYFDFRGYLSAGFTDPATSGTTCQVLYDAGITPTSGDLTDIAAGISPRSIRASGGTDNIHMINAGYQGVAYAAFRGQRIPVAGGFNNPRSLTAKGWLNQ